MLISFYKRLRIFAVLLVAGGPVFSQAGDRAPAQHVYLRVDSVFSRRDSVFAWIDGGVNIGVEKGMLGNFYNAVKGNGDVSLNTGYGIITGLEKERALCYVRNVYDENNSIGEGDLLVLKLELPYNPYPDIFYDLALLGIKFSYFDKRPLFSLSTLLKDGNATTEDSLKQEMIRDIRFTYERVKDRSDLPPALTSAMTYGRYKGKTTIETLRDITMADLNSFLLYVKTYPAKYIGFVFRAGETFAGWASSSGPYSYVEVERALLPLYRDKAAFNEKLPIYLESFLN